MSLNLILSICVVLIGVLIFHTICRIMTIMGEIKKDPPCELHDWQVTYKDELKCIVCGKVLGKK